MSTAVREVIRGPVADAPELRARAEQAADHCADSLGDDDLQVSLTMLYELHYRGWGGVDDAWEWQPDLVAAARSLEAVVLRDLRRLVQDRFGALPAAPHRVPEILGEIASADIGPSLSRHLARRATREQYAEFLIHRSIYHLKEADPHTWAIPRLAGSPKAALVEVQADEYGGGRPEWMHAALFAAALRGLGLTDRYAAYVSEVPAVTLGWANTMTLFGLHRRHRGMIAGHLAALEMTSSLPNRRYGNGLRRLGLDAETTRFFDEHVEADAVHEQIACHDLAGRLAVEQPALTGDIVFGAAAALATDTLVAEHMLSAWEAGASSLRSPAKALAG